VYELESIHSAGISTLCQRNKFSAKLRTHCVRNFSWHQRDYTFIVTIYNRGFDVSQIKIIAVNNILPALHEYSKSGGEFIYSPIASSVAQIKFYQERFTEVKQIVSTARLEINKIWPEDKNHLIFSWDAWNEKDNFNTSIAENAQNRLFDNIDFSAPDSFSGFRKLAEEKLPIYFYDALDPNPFDADLKKRIQHYFYDTNCPSTYFETRNGMINVDDSSRFSPSLACGALDVKYLYNEIKNYEKRNGANKSTYWLVFELLWREFFYWHYQNWQRKYFSLNGINGPDNYTEFEVYNIASLKQMSPHKFWQSALKELKQTGFQTNRTRQLFASFWIHELGLEWRSGAKLFEDHLIDYDVYSNWGNWMYIAGVGVDARGGRKFNIESQIKRYNPKGEYYAKWAD